MDDDGWSDPRDEDAGAREEPPARFPLDHALIVAALIALHLAIVLWIAAGLPPGWGLIEWGALRKGATFLQPWRLVTSLLLHSGIRHVLANGVSMMVFAVPLLSWVGLRRTAIVYLAAGVGGGITAAALTDHGTYILGSSGAVSGLFGAWVVLALARARESDLPRRARIRAAGIALLVLPSLVNPTTADGGRISVSSHLGGAATGMAVGILLSRGWLRRERGWGRFPNPGFGDSILPSHSGDAPSSSPGEPDGDERSSR
jgi:rhomboid protease GluP